MLLFFALTLLMSCIATTYDALYRLSLAFVGFFLGCVRYWYCITFEL
jgi:hypothetical protein